MAPQMARWACSLHAAVAQTSLPWLSSLARIADTKAKTIEDAASRSHLAVWRARLGTITSSKSQAAPTKTAYRWVRGLVGWHHSPIGVVELNNSVPDVGEDGDLDPSPHSPGTASGIQTPLADQTRLWFNRTPTSLRSCGTKGKLTPCPHGQLNSSNCSNWNS